MTREEAIMHIDAMINTAIIVKGIVPDEYDMEALRMAIEALQEPKTIIGIDIPYGSDKGLAALFKGKDDKLILEEVKEIMSVVRCKDCVYCEPYAINTGEDCMTGLWCGKNQKDITLQDFCSWGERKGGDKND